MAEMVSLIGSALSGVDLGGAAAANVSGLGHSWFLAQVAAGPAPLAETGGSSYWWLWALLALVAAFAGVLLYYLTNYLRISLKLFLDTKMPLTAGLGTGPRLEGELHQFPSRDGTSLAGNFIEPPPGVPVRGNVIFAHEYASDRHSAVRYTSGLPERGFRVFAFDFRGHGESSGGGNYRPCHWVTDKEVGDLLSAVAYLKSIEGQAHPPLAVMGVSRGACTAALAAIQDPDVRALIVDGLFSTDLMVEGMMRRWATIFVRVNLERFYHRPELLSFLRAMTVLYGELTMRCRYPLVRKALTRLKDVPVFYIYGDSDAYIDKSQRIKLYRTKLGVKQLWEIPQAKHNQGVLQAPQDYRAQIVQFLEAHLVPQGGPAAPGGTESGRGT